MEELLQTAAQTEDAEDELCFVIDEHLRVIAVPERGVVLGVEGDKDVNRVRFAINRYYHGSDLSKFVIRINYENADGDRNYFTVTEKTVDETQLGFIWTVASDATACRGTVRFVVNCFIASASGVVSKAYHTTLGTARVLEGMAVDADRDMPEIVDFLTQLENDLTVHAGTLLKQAQTAASNAKKSADAAQTSETNAASSASTAKTDAEAADKSAEAAKASETASASSAAAAAKSQTAAAGSADEARTYAGNASDSADKAEDCKEAAGRSEQAANQSVEQAGIFAAASEASRNAAEKSAAEAKASENGSSASADLAKGYETQAGFYADAAKEAVNKSIEGYSGGYSRTFSLTAPQGSWTELETPVGIYQYSASVPLEDCTAKWNAFAAVLPESYLASYKARLANVVQTEDGAVRLYAVNAPDADILFVLSVFAVGSETYYVTAPADGWALAENAVGSKQWQCDIELEDSSARKVPMGMVALENTDEALAQPCLCATMETFDGSIRVYATKKPAFPINLIVILLARNEVN